MQALTCREGIIVRHDEHSGQRVAGVGEARARQPALQVHQRQLGGHLLVLDRGRLQQPRVARQGLQRRGARQAISTARVRHRCAHRSHAVVLVCEIHWKRHRAADVQTSYVSETFL